MGSRNYCFTIFFNDAEQAAVPLTALPPRVKYLVWQLERCPNTQRLHWQGYLELEGVMRMNAVKQLNPLFAAAHFERRAGSQDEAIAYCKKPESRVAGPWEIGQPAIQGRKRHTIADVTDYYMENPQCTMEDLEQLFPSVTLLHYSKIENFLSRQKRVKVDDSSFVPRPWQQHLLNLLAAEPNDRTVIWVTDTVGNMGKSRLAFHLQCQFDAVSLSGQLKDMAFTWRNKPSKIAIFDISRAQAEYSNHVYSMAESLKNRFLCSSKYESVSFTFPAPHVIIFSNKSWNRELFSADRVLEIDLSSPQYHQLLPPAPPPPPSPDLPAGADLARMLAELPDDRFW